MTSKDSQGQLQKNDLLMMLSLNMVDKASIVEFSQSFKMCLKHPPRGKAADSPPPYLGGEKLKTEIGAARDPPSQTYKNM